jgi:hypothetical protein
MRGFALAGDAMHANNARFMMAFSAADDGLDPERTAELAAECAEYARSTGNAHELAHARLVQAMLRANAAERDADPGAVTASVAAPEPEELDDLADLLASFRRFGDLRCVTRSLVLQARREPDPSAAAARLAEALSVADATDERTHQTSILTRLIALHWSRGDRDATLAALGRLAALAGPDAASAACPPELAVALDADLAAVGTPGRLFPQGA